METDNVQQFLDDNDYTSLTDYFYCLSADYGVPLQVVIQLYDLLGPSEIGDGLVAAVESASESDWL